MKSYAFMNLEIHTVTHPSLVKYIEAKQRNEIVKLREKLEQIIGNVESIGYGMDYPIEL